LFKGSDHGYNLNTLYNKCEGFSDSYEHCVILIESVNGAIFGAYLDLLPDKKQKKFVGSYDSFVFTLKPALNKFTVGE